MTDYRVAPAIDALREELRRSNLIALVQAFDPQGQGALTPEQTAVALRRIIADLGL